jgi:hypothetical protein
MPALVAETKARQVTILQRPTTSIDEEDEDEDNDAEAKN